MDRPLTNFTPQELELAALLHNAMTVEPKAPGDWDNMVEEAHTGNDAPMECMGAAVQTALIARNMLNDEDYFRKIVDVAFAEHGIPYDWE